MQPLFYAALAFALGIGAAGLLAPPAPAWFWGALAAALSLIPAAALCARRRRISLLLWLAVCASAGLARAQWARLHTPPQDSLAQVVNALHLGVREPVELTGYVQGAPEATARYLRFDLACRRLEARGRIWAVRGGIRLYGYLRPPITASRTPAFTAAAKANPAPPIPSAAATAQIWTAWRPQLQPGRAVKVRVHPRALRAYRDPGVPDFSRRLREAGLDFQASLRPAQLQFVAARPGGWSMRLRAALWSALSRRLDRLLPPARYPQLNAVARAMLLGDELRLDEATRRAFQIDGIYHLLVVAGLHIAILAGFLFWLGRRLRLSRWAAGGLSLLALYGYAWLIAAREPAERALLMISIYMLARWWYRERQPLNAVGAAALLLLAWRPLALANAGWQMSFTAATLLAGIAYPVAAQVFGARAHALARWRDAGFTESLDPRWAQFRLDWQLRLKPLARRSPLLGDRLLPGLLRAGLRLGEIGWVSLVLQLGFAGFMIADFHRYNSWAVLANTLVVPLAALLLPLTWLALGCSFAAGGLARLAGGIVQPAARAADAAWSGLLARCGYLLLWLARALTRLPQAAMRVPRPPLAALVLYAALLAFWLVTVQRWRRRQAELERQPVPARLAAAHERVPPLVAAALMLAIWSQALAWLPFPPRLPARRLEAWVLDVGQGDSILVSFPGGRTMLVDAGPATAGGFNAGRELVSPFLWWLGLRRLDAVLLTHAHRDHIGGMAAVLRRFHPRELWVADSLPPEAAVSRLLRVAAAEHLRLRRVAAGERFRIGASYLSVLAPAASYRPGLRAANADSVVARIAYGNGALLLEGDAERLQEEAMVASGWPLASTVLKAGHHGSQTSSTPAFLAAVHPAAALISAGAGNLYGLPAPAILERLKQDGIRVFRTDRGGAVECRFSGTRLRVFRYRPAWR